MPSDMLQKSCSDPLLEGLPADIKLLKCQWRRCLHIVASKQKVSAATLSKELGVSPATAKELVDRLVLEGIAQGAKAMKDIVFKKDELEKAFRDLALAEAPVSLHNTPEADVDGAMETEPGKRKKFKEDSDQEDTQQTEGNSQQHAAKRKRKMCVGLKPIGVPGKF